MKCNLDARGKAVRLISGIIVSVLALVLMVLLVVQVLAGTWLWVIAALALLLGAFQIFEARAGWCVVRAMGFKTPT
jgi:hypothetical protein